MKVVGSFRDRSVSRYPVAPGFKSTYRAPVDIVVGDGLGQCGDPCDNLSVYGASRGGVVALNGGSQEDGGGSENLSESHFV